MAIYFLERSFLAFCINNFGEWIYRDDFCGDNTKNINGDIFEIFVTYCWYGIDGIFYSKYTAKNIAYIRMDKIRIREIIIGPTR